MSILDLAFRFNSPLSGGNGSVPAGTNLGQQASSDRSLNLLVKRPARRAWDTWDTPTLSQLGQQRVAAALGHLGRLGQVGQLGRLGHLGQHPGHIQTNGPTPLTDCCPDRARTPYRPKTGRAHAGESNNSLEDGRPRP